MQDEKYDEIAINHNADEDCKGKKDGKWLALEYEIKGIHTTEELLEKKADRYWKRDGNKVRLQFNGLSLYFWGDCGP